jgi:hypothetical protein
MTLGETDFSAETQSLLKTRFQDKLQVEQLTCLRPSNLNLGLVLNLGQKRLLDGLPFVIDSL